MRNWRPRVPEKHFIDDVLNVFKHKLGIINIYIFNVLKIGCLYYSLI